MFNNYAEFLKQTFDAVFNNEQSKPTFLDYLGVLGQTILLIATILFSAIVICVLFYLPYLCYKRYITKYYNETIIPIENDLDGYVRKGQSVIVCKTCRPKKVVDDEVVEEIIQKFKMLDLLTANLIKRKTIYWFTVVLVWVPLMIPTLLFLLSYL